MKVPSFKGHRHTEEAKKRISVKSKELWASPGFREKMSEKRKGENNPFFGKTHSEASLKKMSESHTGVSLTEDHKKKVSKSLIGNKRALGNKYKLTLEQRKHLSEIKKGDNNHFWKGGVCSENAKIRSSFEYKVWRESVFKRDDYTCVKCGARSGKGQKVYLNADHIKPFSLYPDLRFDLNNGRTLCKPCHLETKTFGRRAIMEEQVESLHFIPSLRINLMSNVQYN